MNRVSGHDDSEPLDIDEELRDLIKPELAAGERLLWAGRSGPMDPIDPRNSRIGEPNPWFALAFALCGILFACVCGFFYRQSQDPKQSDALLVFTLIASGLSLLMFAGFCVACLSAWRARRSKRNQVPQRTYALTDRRVVRWDRDVSPGIVEVISIPFASMKAAEMIRYERKDGSGDLLLRGRWDREASLESISQVQHVERLLREHLPKIAWKSDPNRNEGLADPDDVDFLTY